MDLLNTVMQLEWIRAVRFWLLIGVGIAAGLLCALGTGVLMSKLLFHTRPWDIFTFLGVTILLAASAITACLIPAHRAAAVEPIAALRSE